MPSGNSNGWCAPLGRDFKMNACPAGGNQSRFGPGPIPWLLLSLESGVLLLDLGEKVGLGQKVQGHAGFHFGGDDEGAFPQIAQRRIRKLLAVTGAPGRSASDPRPQGRNVDSEFPMATWAGRDISKPPE
jgi:hypothetical protein